MLFDERKIKILAYNLETILAEKIETVLSRGAANTQSRDFYDIYILFKIRGTSYDKKVLFRAIEKTANSRGTKSLLKMYSGIITSIRTSQEMQLLWRNYQKNYAYAKSISFDEACDVIQYILDDISIYLADF